MSSGDNDNDIHGDRSLMHRRDFLRGEHYLALILAIVELGNHKVRQILRAGDQESTRNHRAWVRPLPGKWQAKHVLVAGGKAMRC